MALSYSMLRSGFSSLWRSSTTFHYSLKMLSPTSNHCQIRDSSATNTGKIRRVLNPKLKNSTKVTGNSNVNESKQSTHTDSLAEFIAEFEGLIESRNQTITTAKQNRTYNPYSREWKEWAESFYVIKGDLTSASLFSLDDLPDLLRNICDDEKCRRDFVLYKDIPLSEASMDFRENFQQEGFEYNKHLLCPNIELKLDVPLPNGHESVLPLPEGFHVILNSSSLRIISYVTREELFGSWRLDLGEQEKHINMLCRRNGQKRMMALMSRNRKEGISKVSCRLVHTDVRKGKRTYTDILSYIGGFSEPCLGQKQLIDKFINLCTKGGKKTKSRAIAYQTLQRLAGTEGVTKLLEQAVGNVKPICELDKVRVAGTTYHVPDFVHRDRQQTLAIRWILEAASKRRTSKRINLDQCLSAEILDAYRKRGIARKKRDDIHQEASKNRSFVHFRWS